MWRDVPAPPTAFLTSWLTAPSPEAEFVLPNQNPPGDQQLSLGVGRVRSALPFHASNISYIFYLLVLVVSMIGIFDRIVCSSTPLAKTSMKSEKLQTATDEVLELLDSCKLHKHSTIRDSYNHTHWSINCTLLSCPMSAWRLLQVLIAHSSLARLCSAAPETMPPSRHCYPWITSLNYLLTFVLSSFYPFNWY